MQNSILCEVCWVFVLIIYSLNSTKKTKIPEIKTFNIFSFNSRSALNYGSENKKQKYEQK